MRDSEEPLPKNSVLSRVHMFENKAMEKRQDYTPGSRPSYRPSPSPGRRSSLGSPVTTSQQRNESPQRQEAAPTHGPPSNSFRRSTPSPGRRFAASQRSSSPFEVSRRQDIETMERGSSEREPVEEQRILPHRAVVASPSAFYSSKKQQSPSVGLSPFFDRSVQSPGRHDKFDNSAITVKDSEYIAPGRRFVSPQREPKVVPQQQKQQSRPAETSQRHEELPFARLSAIRPSREPEGIKGNPPNRRATSASPLRTGRTPRASPDHRGRGKETGDTFAPRTETKRVRASSLSRGQSGGEKPPSFSPYNTFQKAIEEEPNPPSRTSTSRARDQSPSGRETTASHSDFFSSRFAKALEGSLSVQPPKAAQQKTLAKGSPSVAQRKAVLGGNHSDLSNPFSIEIRTGASTKMASKTTKKLQEAASKGNVIELTWPKHLQVNPQGKIGSTTVSTSQPSTGSSRGNPFINMKLATSRSSAEGGSKMLQRNLHKSSSDDSGSSSSSSESSSTLSAEDLGQVTNRALFLSKGAKNMEANRTGQTRKPRMVEEKNKRADTGATKIYSSALRLSNQIAPPTVDDIGSVDSSVTSASTSVEKPVFDYSMRVGTGYEEESSIDVIAAIGSIDSETSSMHQGYSHNRFVDSSKHQGEEARRPVRKDVKDYDDDDESEPSHIRRSNHLSNAVLGTTNQFLAQSLAKNQRVPSQTSAPAKQLQTRDPQRSELSRRNYSTERNREERRDRSTLARGRSEKQIPESSRYRNKPEERSKRDKHPTDQALKTKIHASERVHPVRTSQGVRPKPLGGNHFDERHDLKHNRRAHLIDPTPLAGNTKPFEKPRSDRERKRKQEPQFGSPPPVKSKSVANRAARTQVEDRHNSHDFGERFEQLDDTKDESPKSSSTHELTALVMTNSPAARNQADPIDKAPRKKIETTVYTRLNEEYDHQEESSDSSGKKDPFLWLHKKYGDKSPVTNQEAIQVAIARSSNERISSLVRGVSPKKNPPTLQISEDDDDVFDGIDDDSLLKDDWDMGFENRVPTQHGATELTRRTSSPAKRKAATRVKVQERRDVDPTKTEPKHRSPNKKPDAKHSGKTIGDGFVKTVVSDITTSLITMDKNRLARHYRASNDKEAINEEPENSREEGETMDDAGCREPPSVLVNISHAIVNSFQNACKAPAKTEGGCNTSVNAKCGEKLNETWAILNLHTHEEQEDDGADTLLGQSLDGNEEAADTATTKTNETMTTNMLNDMERRIWEAWDKRNKKDNNKEEEEIEETLQQSSSSSAEQDENHKEALNTAKASLLAHAGRALELFGHTVAQSHSSQSESSFTRPRPEHAGSPYSRVSSTLSFNEQSNLERFSSALKNEGIEVLKLGRRNKWQVRYLTVSREVTKLGTGGMAGDIGQCPKALLWPKQFKEHAFSISQIKEDGRGGVLFEKLKKVRPTISNEFYDHHLPKKLKANFPEFAGVVLDYEHEQGVRQLHLCFKTKEDAHAFITAMLIIKEATERTVFQMNSGGALDDVENRVAGVQ